MKKLSFVSNTITNSFNRYFKKEFEVFHYDLDTIFNVLNSKCDSDYLVVLFDYRFFYDTYIDKLAYDKLSLLQDNLSIFRTNNKTKILLSNVSSSFIDFNSLNNISMYQKLIDINIKLEEISNDISDIAIINIFNLSVKIGLDNFISKSNMYLFQTPFTKLAIEAISNEILKKIKIFETKRAKILAIDADNTLWGGIIGEDGIDGIKIDNNYPGIIYNEFQKQLLMLKDSGLVLCMVSKNNYKDVIDVFLNKTMPLLESDFVLKKINWSPKSENIKEIAKEINVGVDSVVFIDDSDFEINEVKEALGIETIQVSKSDFVLNLELLEKCIFLNTLKVTDEDRQKTQMYKAEETRKELKSVYKDISEYIKSLDIKISYNINNLQNLQRITQLINKTNQFNLTTKRYSETEVEKMMEEYKVFDFKVIDKFGDMGIVAIVIVKDDIIDTFLMSCRVLGRNIEKKILYIVQQNTTDELKAQFIKSAKNQQVEDFYDECGFEIVDRTDNTKDYILDKKLSDIEYLKVI